MKIEWVLCAGLTLGLASCGGVNVGNALVQTATENTTPPTEQILQAREFSPETASETMSIFKVHVHSAAFLPEVECTTPNSTGVLDWVRRRVNDFLNLLDLSENKQWTFTFARTFRVCAVRLLLSPTAGNADPSLDIEGTLSDGRPFQVKSYDYHPLVLRSASPLDPIGSTGKGFEVVFHWAGMLDDVDLEALPDNPVIVTPSTTPAAFAAVMRKVRLTLRGYRLIQNGTTYSGDRSTALLEGDETSSAVVSGETTLP